VVTVSSHCTCSAKLTVPVTLKTILNSFTTFLKGFLFYSDYMAAFVGGGVPGGWRRLHNVELHYLQASPCFIRMMKSRSMT
jgi:hypothetical protein